MAYVKPEYRIAKVHMAAGLFVGFTRDAKIIAEKLNTTERNVLRWAKDPEWRTALEAVGYEGDPSFRVIPRGRNPQRENPEVFKKVHYAYYEVLEFDKVKGTWKCAVATAEKVKAQAGLHIEPRTIYNWAKKYNWEVDEKHENPVDTRAHGCKNT